MAKFDPNEHLTKLSGKDYLEVKWRLAWFRDQYPDGIIRTEHIELTDQRAVFKATITKFDGESDIGSATGYGSETPKDFKDYIEKAETKAIGRALAALGFGTQFAPELDEGSRIVDSPVPPRNTNVSVQAPQRPPDAPKPANAGASTPATADLDTARSMKRAHAVAAKHGITHEGLREIARMKARAKGQSITSLSEASAELLEEISDGIEAKPDDTQKWLAKQAELLPGVSLTVPSAASKYTN